MVIAIVLIIKKFHPAYSLIIGALIGGIIGTIIEATEKTFKVETSSGTEMEILRSCVQGVVTPEGATPVQQ